MEHIDADDLALVALGETVPDAVRDHLAGCSQCADEVTSLAAVVAVGRRTTAADTLVAPPPQVWDAIAADLDLGGERATEGAGTSPSDAGGAEVVPLTGRRGAGRDGRQADDGGGPGRPAGGGSSAPRRRTTWIAAAAAAGVVVGAAGGTWWASRGGSDPAASDVVARADLEPLPGWSTTGQAVVEVDPDGSRTLLLTLEPTPEQDGFREVWLIDRDVTRLISLGVLEGTEGEFTVPAGVDLTDFAVVDVSEEPYDGDPGHSGDSIIRGILDA